MIMKFDHIAFSCSRTEIDEKLKQFSSYEKVFYEKDLPNIEAKKDLLSNDAPYHDIILLKHTSRGIFMELTAYEEVSGTAKYDLEEQAVIVHTSSIESSINFYKLKLPTSTIKHKP